MTLTPNTHNTPSEILGQITEQRTGTPYSNNDIIEAMKLYATGKVKEALRVAVSTAQCYVSESDGELLAHFIGELETELVENINKEK